ncbi:hypothetical protein FRC20_001040 [Serendipita sp. 405]|nr:hypothetical protein FRC20_001040 [Serendipita sp. 405]
MRLTGIVAIILSVSGAVVAQGNEEISVIGATSRSVQVDADVSVVGVHTVDAVPDVSVVGAVTVDAASLPTPSATPDVVVVGDWTMSDSGVTRTECYQVSGGVPVATAQPTSFDGDTPQGYQCYAVLSSNGGVLYSPINSASTPTSNKVITVVLPVVVSIVGLIAIVGAFFVYRRYHARRNVAAALATGATDGKHGWVNRPGGWAKDEAAAETGSVVKY